MTDSEENDSNPGSQDSEDKPKLSLKERMVLLKGYLKTPHGKITVSVVVGLSVLILLLMKACEPAKGSPLYGVCGAFLEQQIEYPELIEHNYIEQYQSGVRIYYTQMDSFGQRLTEFIECSFERTPDKGLQLTGVVFNTIKKVTKKAPVKNKGRIYEVEQEYIDIFNSSNSIPTIIESEPDLTLPRSRPLFL